MLKLISSLLVILGVASSASAFADSDVKWNVSTNPLGLIVGPNVAGEYKIQDHLTLGPSLSLLYLNVGGVKATGYNIGFEGKYYFNQALVEHGWWILAGLNYGSGKFKYTDSSGKESNGDARTASLRGLGGYQWFWGHFNLALGAGLTINYVSNRDITDQNGNKTKDIPYVPVGLGADASLGWTF